MAFKTCFVDGCLNNISNTPDKIFIPVPFAQEIRTRWYAALNKTEIPRSTSVYCCEDHFNAYNFH